MKYWKKEFHSLKKYFSSEFKKNSSTSRHSSTNIIEKNAKQYMRSTFLMFTKFHFYNRLIRKQLHLHQHHLHFLLHHSVTPLALKVYHLFFFFDNIYLNFSFQKYNIDRKKITLNQVINRVTTTQKNIHNKANTKLKIK